MRINKKQMILLFIGLSTTGLLPAQVGINIDNPQGWFHVDPLGNTAGANNGEDDIIILPNGNMGIGTLSPSTKLHIQSPTPGAIRIVDGTQGVNKVLTSDANGVGRWEVSKGSLIPGRVFDQEVPLPGGHTWVATNSYIIIPPRVSCIISCMAQFSIKYAGQPGLFLSFSETNTAYKNVSPNDQVIFNRQYSSANSFLICNGFVTDIRNDKDVPVPLYVWAATDTSAGISYNPANTTNDIKLYAIVY